MVHSQSCTRDPRVDCRAAIEGVWKVDHAVFCDVASGMRAVGATGVLLRGCTCDTKRCSE